MLKIYKPAHEIETCTVVSIPEDVVIFYSFIEFAHRNKIYKTILN